MSSKKIIGRSIDSHVGRVNKIDYFENGGWQGKVISSFESKLLDIFYLLMGK